VEHSNYWIIAGVTCSQKRNFRPLDALLNLDAGYALPALYRPPFRKHFVVSHAERAAHAAAVTRSGRATRSRIQFWTSVDFHAIAREPTSTGGGNFPAATLRYSSERESEVLSRTSGNFNKRNSSIGTSGTLS